jgi:hypothetical protein
MRLPDSHLRLGANPSGQLYLEHPREYRSWSGAIQRCTNPNNSHYGNYGGRGISICDRWRLSFAAFMADMGPQPSDRHSIDRIDSDGDYEPGNCRWATPDVQRANRRPRQLSAPTDAQISVLRAIGDSLRCDGVAPTMRELVELLGFASTNAVFDHVIALERRGLLNRLANRARVVLLTDDGWAALGVPHGHCPHCGQSKPGA